MVLDATQLLKEDEINFLTDILLPRGLRNIFFVINKWNMIEDHVVDPAEAEQQKAELNDTIRLRLNPHCVVNGQDRSGDRIFRVNALGALKARLKKSVDQASLEESNIPAFERSLQRFLLEDRGKAISDALHGKLKLTQEKITEFIHTQLAMAEKPISELLKDMESLQPKLDRLRSIRKYILNYLLTQSALLQDRLINSLYEHIRKLDEKIPEKVDEFDLSPITSQSLIWAKLTDWTRSDENKLKSQIQRCIEPQVQRLLERHFGAWQSSVVANEMKAVAIDVEKHLQEEAAEYQRVMVEIEKQIEHYSSPIQIKELVQRWLGTSSLGGTGPINILINPISGDVIGVLLAGIITELITELVVHTVTTIFTFGLPLIYSLIRMGMRENEMRTKLNESIVKSLRDALKDIGMKHGSKIRESIVEGFVGLEETVGGNIALEINMIEASLQKIIDQKSDAEYSARALHEKLQQAQSDIDSSIRRMVSILNG